uniref:protein-serine/threonine phosphatase n=2 Tax=Pyramimonas obovata TaxID=1411642 RepID=A0A7S0WRT3_9CHLO|mmetsp:Transcript_36871/g.80324  ORF Transcript_36871/g.80324 Transcript_36871/m.80324 type:complete len:429 (+) Transcript_36871:358-1644(+)
MVEMDLNNRTEQKTKVVRVENFKLKYAYVCQQGYYPDKPGYVCQDQCTVIEEFENNKNQIFMGVFDGHGKVGCGDVVAKKTKDYLPNKMLQLRASGRYQKFGPPDQPLPDVATSAYERAFDSVSRQILREMREKSNMAGSTAITVFMSGSAIHVANVGDSRAILGRRVATEPSGTMRVIELSKDQTPFRRDERERILSMFPDVEIMTLGMRNGEVPVSDDYGDEDDLYGAASDPPRVWVKDQFYPGSAFSRSIGDAIGKTAGVIAEPEILSRKLTKDDKYLILCSDGVFEFLTNEDVLEIVSLFPDPYEAAAELVNVSFRLWLENDDRTDDITALVVHLEYADDSDMRSPNEKAQAQWHIARTRVAEQLESRPSRKFRNVVREAQKREKRLDKDNYVLDNTANLEEDLGGSVLKSGMVIAYDVHEESF